MNDSFQLWDTTTGNLVTEFDSEDEAIEALRSVHAKDGDESLLEFALVRFQDDRPTLVAKDRDLVLFVTRARRAGDHHRDDPGSPDAVTVAAGPSVLHSAHHTKSA